MRPHLPALTSLRFFAALYVLIVHFGLHVFTGTRLADFARLGSSGVSMFFVLSGFILTYTYAGRPAQPGRFWWARFARIWPVYLLSLVASLPVFWPRIVDALGRGFSPGEIVARFVTATQAWTLSGDAIRLTGAINNPSWSISTEAGFYLVFPLLLVLVWRLPTRTVLIATGVAWVVFTLPTWLVAFQSPVAVFPWEVVYKSPVFRLSEFVVGIAAAVAFLRHPEWFQRPRLGALAWALVLVLLMFGMDAGFPRRALISGTLAPVFALVITTLAAGNGPVRLLSWAPLVFLGEVSYAFYLAHYPAGLYAERWGLQMGTNAHLAVTFLVTLVVSAAAYLLVEAPARRWLRGLASRSRSREHTSQDVAVR